MYTTTDYGITSYYLQSRLNTSVPVAVYTDIFSSRRCVPVSVDLLLQVAADIVL